MKIGYYNIDLWSFMDKTDNLKNYLLLFDKITIEHGPLHLVEKLMGVLPNGKQDFKEKLDYISLLEKKGLIEILDAEKFTIPEKLMSKSAFVYNYKKSIEHYSKIKGIKERNQEKGLIDIYADFMENDRTAGEYSSRYRSIVLNHKNPENEYIPIVKDFTPTGIKEVDTSKSVVLSIVLKNFPLINPNIDLERIVEFKKAEDIKSRYFELRDFITSISKQNLTPNEIHEKVEYLLNEYKNGLELIDFKYNLSTLETICIATSEVVENIATLKFSKAVKTLFELNKKELQLLEAEKNIKGREVSFLYKAQNELK